MKGFKLQSIPTTLLRWSVGVNRRFFWLKYVLVFTFIFFTTFGISERNILDYIKLEERYRYINNEIEREQSLLSADSLRLNELKSLGKSVENIARERYLMKSPGEQVFIIKKPDSIQTPN